MTCRIQAGNTITTQFAAVGQSREIGVGEEENCIAELGIEFRSLAETTCRLDKANRTRGSAL